LVTLGVASHTIFDFPLLAHVHSPRATALTVHFFSPRLPLCKTTGLAGCIPNYSNRRDPRPAGPDRISAQISQRGLAARQLSWVGGSKKAIRSTSERDSRKRHRKAWQEGGKVVTIKTVREKRAGTETGERAGRRAALSDPVSPQWSLSTKNGTGIPEGRHTKSSPLY